MRARVRSIIGRHAHLIQRGEGLKTALEQLKDLEKEYAGVRVNTAAGLNANPGFIEGLESIYMEQDDTLAFRRYCCALLYCNSCLMLVNGKKVNACLYILEPETELEIAPIPGKRVLRDLMVEENVLYS